MVTSVMIENLPSDMGDEIGEEIALDARDDGTVTSTILGSTMGKGVLRAMEAKIANISNESDKKDGTESDDETDEREFDKNPTVLYALVQKKLWKETIARAKSNTKEARAFISRKEKDGRIRWRLLPLHAAIVFKAPEDVIVALLAAFPKAAEIKDDQGMLPLHLAFRNNATESVVNSLLLAFPGSVDAPDRKGRLPLTLAKASSSPKREIYIAALEKGSQHYGVAALASAREKIVADQQEIAGAQLKQALKFHESAMSEVESHAVKRTQDIQKVVDEKEKELAKLHENSQVLVDHVASLETQLNTRSDTERFLATKIAKLEEKLKGKDTQLNDREAFWETEVAKLDENLKKNQGLQDEDKIGFGVQKAKLNNSIEGLSADLEETKTKLFSTLNELSEEIASRKRDQEQFRQKELLADAKYAKMEADYVNSAASRAILESQLKRRLENENVLASQVAALASSLAASSGSNLELSEAGRQFESERSNLQSTVMLLKKRLKNVAAVMESTREQQMSILDDAIAQEEMMAKCMESHAQTVSETLAQEKDMLKVKDEMMALIERSFNEANDQRFNRLNISTSHGQSLSSMNASRNNVLVSAQTVTSNVISALENDLNLDTLENEVIEFELEKTKKTGVVTQSNIESDMKTTEEEETVEEASTKVEEVTAEEVSEESTVEKVPEEATAEKAPEETPAESPMEREEEQTEFVEVVLPKKSLSAIVVPADSPEMMEEERRTELDETRPSDIVSTGVDVGRVMAE